jgi:hypothetical protein
MFRTKFLKEIKKACQKKYLNLNTGVLQTIQLYNPLALLLFNGLEYGGSVP